MFNRATVFFLASGSILAQPQIPAPRIWNDRDLAEWATPLPALKVRPGHLSEEDYYSLPIGDWVRSYPVYFPGREPEGYWQSLQHRKPEPLIALGPRTEAEWVQAGRRAFEEMEVPGFRTTNPNSSPGSARPKNSQSWEGTLKRTASCSAIAGFLLRKG